MSDTNTPAEKPETGEPSLKKPPVVKIVALCLLAAGALLGVLYSGAKDHSPAERAQETPAPAVREDVALAGVTALALSPGGKHLAAAYSSGLLRVWDTSTGKQVCVWKASSAALALEYAADGKVLAGLLANNEIRFWNSADGSPPENAAESFAPGGPALRAGEGRPEVAAGKKTFFGGEDGIIVVRDKAGTEIARLCGFGDTPETSEWLTLNAAGYYAGSARGSSLFTVQGKGETFNLEQFREALHRPDLVARGLSAEEEAAGRQESTQAGIHDGISLAALVESGDKFPVVEIIGPAKRTSTASAENLHVRITDRGLGVGRIYVSGDSYSGLHSIEDVATGKREEGGKTIYDATLRIDPLAPGRNAIAVSVFGGREYGAPESKKAHVEITTSWKGPPAAEERPVLHVFTAAIKEYKNAGEDLNKLNYTRADAEALQKTLSKQSLTGNLFSRVEAYGLYDGEVTRGGLAQRFEEIRRKVKETDTFVFFFSGHGDVDEHKDFYFLSADAEGWTSAPEKNIVKHDLLGNLFKIPARNIFVMLDTCHSGALEDTTSAVDRAWGDLSRKTNLAILMAAAGNQYAIESRKDEQGVLTWAVLQALEGSTQEEKTPYVGVNRMMERVRKEAPQKAEKVVAEAAQAAIASVRGYFDSASLVQEPVVRTPREDFPLFDRHWSPAEVSISARTAGRLTIKREGESAQRTVDLQAGRARREYLRQGQYEFIMYYGAGVEPESQKHVIESGNKTAVAFQNVKIAQVKAVPLYKKIERVPLLQYKKVEPLSFTRFIEKVGDFEVNFRVRLPKEETFSVAGLKAIIVDYTGKENTITIPPILRGARVEIAADALKGKGIVSVDLSFIRIIGRGAFANNPITVITISANINLDDQTFDNGFVAYYNSKGKAGGKYTYDTRLRRWFTDDDRRLIDEAVKPKPASTVYDYKKNADRLFKRGTEALSKNNTIPESAYYDELPYAGRKLFVIHGAHYNPEHIRNMEKVFEKENVAENSASWLFLVDGISDDAYTSSDYAEIEYAAQSARAWKIPAIKVVPNYSTVEMFKKFAPRVGTEKAIFFLVMFGMQTNDIKYIEGKGYDNNQIRSTITNYIQICNANKIPFDINKLNALFPINTGAWEKTSDECWDIWLEEQHRIAKVNLQNALSRYPNAKNILVYSGEDHFRIYKQETAPAPVRTPQQNNRRAGGSTLIAE